MCIDEVAFASCILKMTRRAKTPQLAAGLASELQIKDDLLASEDSLQLPVGSFDPKERSGRCQGSS